jgi:hypothetical protein
LLIKNKLETIVRASIHKVSVPDSNIAFLVDNLFAWIEQNFLYKEESK